MSVLDDLSQLLSGGGNYYRNAPYLKQDAGPTYRTDLGDQETAFRQWLTDNAGKIPPFNAETQLPQDYDMRGFYRGVMTGDPRASAEVNPNDNRIHTSDYWKTPFHESFSAESQWADPTKAPAWNEQDQLVTPQGQTVFDERAPRRSLNLRDMLRRYGI